MMQLVIFVIALALVFAIKAVAVARTHDELAQNAAAFSWMSARPQDEAKAAAWATEEAESIAPRTSPARSAQRLTHVGA